MKENEYQKKLIKTIKNKYPDCIIMKEDASYIQGLPDLIILKNKKWATLECKKSEKESHQPNQDYYVGKMNQMSFSKFIFPENETEVLEQLDLYFNS